MSLKTVFLPCVIIIAAIALVMLFAGSMSTMHGVAISFENHIIVDSRLRLKNQTYNAQHTITTTQTPVEEELRLIYRELYKNASQTRAQSSNETCALVPPDLVGPIKLCKKYYPMNMLQKLDFHVERGGHYSPGHCKALQQTAIIIPYRNRMEHLAVLLMNLHPFLQKQQISYTFYVVNQTVDEKFNRAALLNIGFIEAMKERKYDCLIFHDVDLLPENDKHLYRCPEKTAKLFAVAIDKFSYRPMYEGYLGGVSAIRSELFLKVNGYSNQFFGWGGEDDDFYQRCNLFNMSAVRDPVNIARYQMIKHVKDKGNEDNSQRFQLIKTVATRQKKDGLNSMVYDLKSTQRHPLYTELSVKIDQRKTMNAITYNITQKYPFLKGLV